MLGDPFRNSLPCVGLLALLLLRPPARVLATDEKPHPVVLEAAGYLVPVQQVTVSPQVPGVVVRLDVVEGQVVKAGQVLARLEPIQYEIALRKAEARLALARARQEKSKAAGKEDLAIARARVAMAQADVDRCRWRLDATVIRAPISGTVLTRKVEVANLVNPLAFNASASICELADLTSLEVDVAVSEKDLARVSLGQLCQVRLDADPAASYKGQVARVWPVADRAKGTVSVRVRLQGLKHENPLRPESRAVVQFLARR